MADEENEAGTVATQVAVSLLMLESSSDLVALQRGGWFRSAGRDRWRIVDIVQGYIRSLKETIGTATTQELSAVFGISGMRIRQLAAEGWFKPAGKNRWNREEATAGYIKFLRAEDRRSTKSAAENRVRDARAREIEQRVAEHARELIALTDALDTLDMIVGMVRTEMGGVAARVTRDLALRRVIEKAINDALGRIVERLRRESAALRSGNQATDAVEALDT
jgi:hypothetical protein